MGDMSAVIQPKSDQLNADSLLAGPITIKVTKVMLSPGTEQPCSVHYEGDNGKPFKPCKSMARVLVNAWGADSSGYVGKSMTLYRDPDVKWAGMAVGGIRISNMSHIERDMVFSLTASKGNPKPFKVKPLKAAVAPLKAVQPSFDLDKFASDVKAYVDSAADGDELAAWWGEQRPFREQARDADKNRAGEIATMVTEKIESFKNEAEN